MMTMHHTPPIHPSSYWQKAAAAYSRFVAAYALALGLWGLAVTLHNWRALHPATHFGWNVEQGSLAIAFLVPALFLLRMQAQPPSADHFILTLPPCSTFTRNGWRARCISQHMA